MKRLLLFILIFIIITSCGDGNNTGNYFKGKKLKDNTFKKEISVELEKVNVPEGELDNI